MTDKKSKGDEFIEDIKALSANVLTEHSGIDADTAEQLANELASNLHQLWAGQIFYIPKFSTWVLTKRDLEIYDKWNGSNMHQLCQEFKLSSQHIYSIVNRVRSARPKDQFDLFDKQ